LLIEKGWAVDRMIDDFLIVLESGRVWRELGFHHEFALKILLLIFFIQVVHLPAAK